MLRRYVPIILAIAAVAVSGYFLLTKEQSKVTARVKQPLFKSEILAVKKCASLPHFLSLKSIGSPILIDLSQQRFKGVALLYGRGFEKVYHPLQWEQYEHMGTYTLSADTDIYLAPIPYISIRPTTFNLQNKIYKIDSNSGKLEIYKEFEDVKADANNPYGIVGVEYDCDDDTLWVSAIDRSDYTHARGRLYHVDLKTKKILAKKEGLDLLTLKVVYAKDGKYILAADARTPRVVAIKVSKDGIEDAVNVLSLPDPNLRVRKIKPIDKDLIKLEAIPFNYTLVARSSNKNRVELKARYDKEKAIWSVIGGI